MPQPVSEKRYDTYQGSAHMPLEELEWKLLSQLGALWRARNAQERRVKMLRDTLISPCPSLLACCGMVAS